MTRDEAIKRLKEYAQYSYGIWHNNEEDTKAFDMAIDALQAEPVVRCKDCRWWDDMYGDGVKGYCHACKHGYYSPTWEISIQRTTDSGFYCSDGERREP